MDCKSLSNFPDSNPETANLKTPNLKSTVLVTLVLQMKKRGVFSQLVKQSNVYLALTIK